MSVPAKDARRDSLKLLIVANVIMLFQLKHEIMKTLLILTKDLSLN